ncbi:unnamed protein product, partial [Leptidea sinapis]
MPRSKGVMHIIMDLAIVFAVIVVAGHISTSFWEKHMLQHEILSMKASLNTLKRTIHNIGTAYDDLHRELHYLVEVESNGFDQTRKPSLDRRKQHDINILTAFREKDLNLRNTSKNEKGCMINNFRTMSTNIIYDEKNQN